MVDLSESEEEYLESLYRLDGSEGRVGTSDLAKDMKIKEPSVVEMLRKLQEKDLVDYKSYAGARLTPLGKEEGMKVTRRHRLAERLLWDVLDRDLSQIHEEACKLEHSMADETADSIDKILDNPKTCPHGNPIPGKEVEKKDRDSIKLTEGAEGNKYRVVSIPEEKEDVQRLLPLAVLPGSEVELNDKPSFGALMVKVGGDTLALSRSIASKIMVEPHGRKKRRRRGRSSR